MLTFIGLGLNDANDLTLKGLAALKAADRIYAEFYTTPMLALDMDELQQMAGKPIIVLDRRGVEEDAAFLQEARTMNVALLTGGDTMCATTHVDLRLRAEREGVQIRMVHNASILTAAASLAGLQHYKFGRTTTIPLPEEGYSPTSPYEAIEANLAAGMHTLVLLDTRVEEGGPDRECMTANQALGLLLQMEERVGHGVITPGTNVCIVARAGSDSPVVRYGTVAQLEGEDFGGTLHCIIVPGRLHFLEEEAIHAFGGGRTDR